MRVVIKIKDLHCRKKEVDAVPYPLKKSPKSSPNSHKHHPRSHVCIVSKKTRNRLKNNAFGPPDLEQNNMEKKRKKQTAAPQGAKGAHRCSQSGLGGLPIRPKWLSKPSEIQTTTLNDASSASRRHTRHGVLTHAPFQVDSTHSMHNPFIFHAYFLHRSHTFHGTISPKVSTSTSVPLIGNGSGVQVDESQFLLGCRRKYIYIYIYIYYIYIYIGVIPLISPPLPRNLKAVKVLRLSKVLKVLKAPLPPIFCQAFLWLAVRA